MTSVQRYEKLTDDQLLRVHSICERYERLLLTKEDVTLERHIEAAPESLQAVLFRELLEIELAAIKARGETADSSQYEARFPDRVGEIQVVFAEIFGHDLELVIPKQISRYQIERLLGRGGFANVYLGFDDQLQRSVAIKVPRPDLVSRRQVAREYLNEAQAVASLDHPHIVPVHDVGRTDEIPCYVVSKYVEGSDLGRFLRKNRLSWRASAELIANMADALHHAHTRGLIHRDVKPANILLDANQNAYLTDFGVALKDIDAVGDARLVGTPAYMSPEQSRGEAHRVDGRSDIYSLGAVFYELLTGRRTFSGKSRIELLERIAHHEPQPPRQIADSIPRELERICLKALAGRARERYTTALDMSAELREFLDSCDSEMLTPSGIPNLSTDRNHESSDRSMSTPAGSNRQPLRIIPRGLRCFDEHDSDFFLSLLPGPRDGNGLPDNVGFWKTRVEESDPARTFQVGLIYGPSGCGKSSFVRAGLLPRFPDGITVVYVESTPGQTESRLLAGLRKHFPNLNRDLSLKETLAALRCGHLATSRQKVLIVLDQFEQWLHSKPDPQRTPLVEALRQCDGERLQCIVLVRDDFWLAISRFFRDLEIDLVQGKNIALVDLFDLKHAHKVLTAFGIAYGRLPEDPNEMTQHEKDFLDQAIDGLAVGGKVACVRLTLFAEMMKGREWIPATLQDVGGTEGIGVTFLEETFSSPSANPKHRLHQQAARVVLGELLPDTGIDIKGRMRSYADLLEASGYPDRQRDFDELIRMLDSEIRLITPTDPEGQEGESGHVSTEPAFDTIAKSPSEKAPPGQSSLAGNLARHRGYYQLTHDYLVHSLRDWLTRKQKETRRGRAELQLAERSDLWNRKPDIRHLPSVGEWANIRLLTNSKRWTALQRRMMHQANRFHVVRTGILVVLTLTMAISLSLYVGTVRNRALVERIQTAVETMANSRGNIVSHAIEDLEEYPPGMVSNELSSRFAESKPSQKLALACALAHFDHVDVDFLVSRINRAPASETNNLADALSRSKAEALIAIRHLAESSDAESDWESKQRLAVLGLYLGDTSLAREMSENSPDGVERLKFILAWSAWHGDLAKLVEIVPAVHDATLRAGLCVGMGQVRTEDVTDEAKAAWHPILIDWFQNDPDASVHSSVGWLLRRWNLNAPEVASSQNLEAGRNWHINRTRMTMIKLPAGSFYRRHGGTSRFPAKPDFLDAPLQEVILASPFLMSDSEVTLGQYLQMKDDVDFPESEKPFDGRWGSLALRPNQVVDPMQSPTNDHPVQSVSWNDAVQFCNWLSHHEGLDPCYTRTGQVWEIPTGNFEEWVLNIEADGYRLPTEAEWEYACRAGIATQDPLRDEVNTLLLTVYGAGRTPLSTVSGNAGFAAEAVGTKPPDSWGLFDLNGNVHEWCNDWYERHIGLERGVEDSITDPMGPEKNNGQLDRLIRGGIFYRANCPLTTTVPHLGFRVVRNIQE